MKSVLLLLVALAVPAGGSTLKAQDSSEAAADAGAEWIQLFNGRDLTGWQVKIRGNKLGDNWGNTFRVEDGYLTVGYEAYENFDEKFGHIFYHQPFGHYRLRVEYRFIGEQCNGGPGWAFRNSGIMIHGQSPESMEIDQDFPASIEVQLLGGSGSGTRTTANICTPYTHMVLRDRLITTHCLNSKSGTYHGDQWVTVELEVRGNKLIRNIIDGETVFELTQPQLDTGTDIGRALAGSAGGQFLLSGGSISLQSESHPVQFRKVELLPLER
jgi:hypothetical protein